MSFILDFHIIQLFLTSYLVNSWVFFYENDIYKIIIDNINKNKTNPVLFIIIKLDQENLAPMAGIEPATRGLTVHCYYQLSYIGIIWSGVRESNSQHPAWKAGTLPIELTPLVLISLQVTLTLLLSSLHAPCGNCVLPYCVNSINMCIINYNPSLSSVFVLKFVNIFSHFRYIVIIIFIFHNQY